MVVRRHRLILVVLAKMHWSVYRVEQEERMAMGCMCPRLLERGQELRGREREMMKGGTGMGKRSAC